VNTFDANVRFERPIEEVFAYVSDPLNFPHWNSAVEAVRKTSPGDDDLLFRDRGLGGVGGDEVAAELHSLCVGVGGVEFALGLGGWRVGIRWAAKAPAVLHHPRSR
jgi:hypothetical protein